MLERGNLLQPLVLWYKINSATSNIMEGHAELWPRIQDGGKCTVISCEWHTDEEGGNLTKSGAERMWTLIKEAKHLFYFLP